MKELKINRETIRRLNGEELRNVAGGDPTRIDASDDPCTGGGGGGGSGPYCNVTAKTCGEPNCDSISCATQCNLSCLGGC